MKDYLIRFKGTIFAFLIFVILLASVFLFDRDKQVDVVPEKVFPNLTPEEIKSVKLVDGSTEFTLEKGDSGDWIIVSGSGRHRADKERVDNLVKAVTDMQTKSSIQGGEDKLEEYGFVDSKTEFSVNTEETDYPVIIGGRSPVGSGTYIYDLGEGRILIVDDSYLEGFIDKDVDDYRDKKLFTLDKSSVDRISVKVGDFSVEIKKNNGKWTAADSSGAEAADAEVIKGLLDSYAALRVSDFVNDSPDDQVEFGFDEPLAEIGFYGGDDGELFLFGKRKDESDFYVKIASEEPVYSVSKNYFKILPKNMGQLRSK